MKNYKNAIGNAIIMWIVGSCSVILPVIYCIICYVIGSDAKYFNILMSVSWILGGILAIYVMKKKYHMDIKEYSRKPDLKILMLVIVVAVFYTLTIMYVVYKPMLKGEPGIDTLTIVRLVFTSIANPIGEELTFRFGMLTLLLLAAKDSRFKIMFSIVIVSVVWMMMHLSGYIPRCFEIIFVGIIIGAIYLKSKNIIYCIAFHIVVNTVVFIFASLYPWFLEREYILYISTPLFLFSIVALFYNLYKIDYGKFMLEVEHKLS